MFNILFQSIVCKKMTISIIRFSFEVFNIKLLLGNILPRSLDELLLNQVALVHILGLSQSGR
jgi:hypothetical protein